MAIKWRYLHLLLGMLLLATAGYFLTRPIHGWNTPWREPQPAPARTAPAQPGDPTEAAKLEVYGVLASATEDAAPAEPANTLIPAKAAPIGEEVDWALNSPLSREQKYYLIFRNDSARALPKLVEADFTLSTD